MNASNPAAGEPPPGLRCLARWYTGEIRRHADGWGLQLPTFGFLPWDDGREKTAEERLTNPDLQDVFIARYQTGPIRPVLGDGEIEEPGRVRLEQLLKATYGASPRELELEKWRLFGVRYPVHRRALGAFQRVAQRLHHSAETKPELAKYFRNIGGTYIWRRIQRSHSLSTHSFGIAVDLNTQHAHYWRWQRPRTPLRWRNAIPQEVVDAFENEGFVWGGRWLHYDTMHFEYRPELLDPLCFEPTTPSRETTAP